MVVGNRWWCGMIGYGRSDFFFSLSLPSRFVVHLQPEGRSKEEKKGLGSSQARTCGMPEPRTEQEKEG